MSQEYKIWLLGLIVILLTFGSTAMADEAEDAFNSLYGDELERVAATPSSADDMILAAKLLEAVRGVTGQPALLAVLCEKTYVLAGKSPAGCATALAAMELLAEMLAE